MGYCNCKNSKTGEPKERYATKAQAELACEESQKTYEDGDTLNTFYCFEGDCYHIGNEKPDGAQKSEVRVPPSLSPRLIPDFEPPPEWLQDSAIQTPVSPLSKVKMTVGEIAKHRVAVQGGVPARAVPVNGFAPHSKVVPAEAIDRPSAAFSKVVCDAPVGQGPAPAPPAVADVYKQTEREAAMSVAETALMVGRVTIAVSFLAGRAVARGIRNWLKE